MRRPWCCGKASHHILGAAFRRALAGTPQEHLHEVDITDIYQSARREVFETCPRIELPAKPGEAYVLHRHCLHGVAPWAETASAGAGWTDDRLFPPGMCRGCGGMDRIHLTSCHCLALEVLTDDYGPYEF